MQICAKHGLKYDPDQYPGCVLCRRAAEPYEPASTVVPVRTIAAALFVVALLASGIAVYLRMTGRVKVAPGVPDAAQDCVEGCAARDEPCTNDRRCVERVAQCLKTCKAFPAPEAGGMQLVYAWGDAPPWEALDARLRQQGLPERCRLGRGGFTTRFDVRSDGTLLHSRSAGPMAVIALCIDGALEQLDVADLPKGDYAVVMRGNPAAWSAPRPVPPLPSRAETLGPAQPPDFLSELNRMNPQGAAAAMQEASNRKESEGERATLAPNEPLPPPVSLTPRLLDVRSFASTVISARGKLAVLIFYDSDCDSCAPFLHGITRAMSQLHGRVQFMVYSLDEDDEHARWLRMLQRFSEFEPVRLKLGPDDRRELERQLDRLRIDPTLRVPSFTLIEPDGSIAVAGSGLRSVRVLLNALAARTGVKLGPADMSKLGRDATQAGYQREIRARDAYERATPD